MAGVGTEAHHCLLPFDTAQNDPDALIEIEDEEPDVVPIPSSFTFLKWRQRHSWMSLNKSDARCSDFNTTEIYHAFMND
jgi:hypothetical protein